MTGEDLYDELKLALACFELRWQDKHQIDVTLCQDEIIFSYESRRLAKKVEKK